MSSILIAAVNYADKLVLLDDGRELPIDAFYAHPDPGERLTCESELNEDTKLADSDYGFAEVFTISFPDAVEVFLIVEVESVTLGGKYN